MKHLERRKKKDATNKGDLMSADRVAPVVEEVDKKSRRRKQARPVNDFLTLIVGHEQ